MFSICCIAFHSVIHDQFHLGWYVLGKKALWNRSKIIFLWVAVKKLKIFNTETLDHELMESVKKMSHWNTFLLTKHEGLIKGIIEGIIEGYSMLVILEKKVISSNAW